MKLPKVFFKKLLLGTLLIALAAGVTAMLKEVLDTRDPESALPLITVTYGDETLSNEREVRRAGWEWHFFLTNEKTPLLSLEDVPLTPVEVLPGAQLQISFTKTPSELLTQYAADAYPIQFVEPQGKSAGTIHAPTTPGRYYYKVRAEWAGRGFIQYYFVLQVRELVR